jgi:integrase
MGRGPGIRAVGVEAIQIDFRWKGVRCRERIRLPPTARNLRYAARLKATIEHEIATGTFDYARHFPRSPRARSGGPGPGQGLRSALLAFVDSLAGSIEPETLAKYRHDAATVASWFPHHTLQSLTRGEVRQKLSEQNLSRKRLLNLLTPLRGALQQALDDGVIQKDPLSGFRLRRIEGAKEKIDPFSREEVDRLSGVELGHIWTFWAWTGIRSGELIGLRWGDVDGDGMALTIQRSVRVGREKRPKTAAGKRMVVLLPPARSALRRISREEAESPIFRNPNTGEHWYEDRALARAFRKACEAAEVRYRYPYQLRHTFASWALSTGENPLWVAKQMGHKDVTTIFKIYGKYMPNMNPEAGQKMTSSKGKQRAA